MKKILIITAGAAAAAAILLCSAWLFLNSSFTGGLLERLCFEYTGSALKFSGNPEIKFFPASLTIRDVSWQSPGKEPFLKFSARFLRISPDLFSLARNQIHIKEIFANEASLEINESAPSPPWPKDDPSSQAASPSTFAVDRLVSRNSGFSYYYADQAARLSQMNLSAERLAPRQEMDLQCDFFTDSRIAGEIIAGNMAIRTKLRYYSPNLTFRQAALTFTATENPALTALSPINLDAEGALNINDWSFRVNSSQIKTSMAQLMLNGGYDASKELFDGYLSLDFNLAAQDAEEADRLKYHLVFASPLQYKNRILSFPDIAASSGSSKGSGSLQCVFPSGNKAAAVTGRLALGVLSLPAEKGRGSASGPAWKKETGGAVSWPSLNLSLSAQAINCGRASLKDVSLKAEGGGGGYRLDSLRFGWASGKASGSGSISMRDKLIKISADGNNVDIGKALWELGVDGFHGGSAAFSADLSAAGFDWPSIKKSLNGSLSFDARNTRVSILEEITKFMSRFIPKAGGLAESIDMFSIKARADGGKLFIDPMLIKSQSLEAAAKGEINLEKDSLSAQLSLKAFGMSLPIALYGPLSKLSWRVEPAWLEKIWREF